MFIVVEPRISGDKADKVIRKLRFYHSYKVDARARGFEGGLFLFWNEGSVQGFEKSSKFISFIINQKDSHPWALTAVYASPVPTTRELLWNSLTQFDEFDGIPWMLVGDFFHSYDKQGGGALKLYFSLLIASFVHSFVRTFLE